MRKTLWIMLVGLLVIVGQCRADYVYTFSGPGGSLGGQTLSSFGWSVEVPSFVTTPTSWSRGSLLSVTDPTSPSGCTITQAGFDPETGASQFNVGANFSTSCFFISSGYDWNDGPVNHVGVYTVAYDNGPATLTVTSVPAPEPSSIALVLLGVGFVFALRKRNSLYLPAA